MLGRTPGAAATRGPRSRPRPRARTAGRPTGAEPAAPPSRCSASPWPPPPASSSGRTSCPPRSCCRLQETRIQLTGVRLPVLSVLAFPGTGGVAGHAATVGPLAGETCRAAAARQTDRPAAAWSAPPTTAPLVDWHSDSL